MGIDLYWIVFIALTTGLRKDNVLKFCWEQVNMTRRTIELLKQDNKGKKKYYLPISESLYNLLLEIGPKKKGYLFINPQTGLPYTRIDKTFNTALKKAGIEDFHFHDLRRTFGTWLLLKGVDIRTIQYLLMHSDISTTERYLGVGRRQIDDAVDVINGYMS